MRHSLFYCIITLEMFNSDPLAGLSETQRRFVIAFLAGGAKTIEEGARLAGISPSTVYAWKDSARILSIVDEIRRVPEQWAMALMANAVVKAVQVKIEALDSESEIIRQRAASEILDRVLGKPAVVGNITLHDGRITDYLKVLEEMANASLDAPPGGEDGSLEAHPVHALPEAERLSLHPRTPEAGDGRGAGGEISSDGDGDADLDRSEAQWALLDCWTGLRAGQSRVHLHPGRSAEDRSSRHKQHLYSQEWSLDDEDDPWGDSGDENER